MGIDDGEAIVSCERDHRWQAAICASSQNPVKIKQGETGEWFKCSEWQKSLPSGK
jgi:hypothetical protein